MKYTQMCIEDIDEVISIFIDYYNSHDESSWTYEKAFKRIHQVWTIEDSFVLIQKKDNEIIGFAMGYFKQYDDLLAYELEEIVISYQHQKNGYGTLLMLELEHQVKEKGASLIELLAVNDIMHDNFYGKLKYKNANNLILKSKWID
ncbi:GNAT family N-acetyltransferase [Desulfospira joergensenii]|uniref:GNAT family N-acetyltransferase n=1 Tax=Desulfospira joergensenii TaxID=53329 RepID=UPI0003B73DC4|nr:GNAT family N-acetyltransferase [Desulfospira joergensenii]